MQHFTGLTFTVSQTKFSYSYYTLYVSFQELSAYEVLQDFSDTADDEIRDFLQMVARCVTNIPS